MIRMALLLLLVFPATGRAQPETRSARDIALSGAGAASMVVQPAAPDRPWAEGRAAFDDVSVSVGTTRMYGLPELDPYRVTVRAIGRMSATMDVCSLGMEGYRRTAWGLRFARRHRSGSGSVGVSLRMVSARAGDLPARSALALGMAIRASPASGWGLGVTAEPAWMTRGSRQTGLLPRWSLGIARHVVPSLELLADLRRESPFPIDVLVAVEWTPLPEFHVRAGWTSIEDGVSLGLGVVTARVGFDTAVASHPVLGWTWAIDTTVWIK